MRSAGILYCGSGEAGCTNGMLLRCAPPFKAPLEPRGKQGKQKAGATLTGAKALSIREIAQSTRTPVMTQHIDSQPLGELNPPNRLMLTPGPSSMDPRVYRALATPLVGHLDPWFKGCMDDTQVLLRQIFQTENRLTMPLSASGSGGIEASVVNSLEEGDEAIICVNGVFSERM